MEDEGLRPDEVLERFRQRGALLEGHFALTSGLHSSVYLQCALVLQEPGDAKEFGASIASQFRDANVRTVVSPAIGGIIIGYETARALGARFIWAERQGNQMVLRRGFSISPGERVLVVEDVITTGGSTRETVEVLRWAGAEIVGAASIIDRSGGDADVGVPRMALATLSVAAVSPENCELCKQGDTVIKPGSRKN